MVTEYNIRNGTILWQIANCIKVVPRIFAIALTISEILTLQIFTLKVGQGHVVQFSQSCPSMANIKIYKIVPCIFALVLTVSYVLFQFFLP